VNPGELIGEMAGSVPSIASLQKRLVFQVMSLDKVANRHGARGRYSLVVEMSGETCAPLNVGFMPSVDYAVDRAPRIARRQLFGPDRGC
jgi:hypothetical protein